jgi:hypothetical protein
MEKKTSNSLRHSVSGVSWIRLEGAAAAATGSCGSSEGSRDSLYRLDWLQN